MGPIWLLLLSPLAGWLSVYSVRQFVRVLRLRRDGERVNGTVASVAWIEGNRHRGGKWDVRIRFQTRDGRVLETSPPVKSGFNRLREGQAITVAYEPADPERFAVIESSLQLAGYAGMAIAAAIACVLSALAGLGVIEASHGGV